MELSRYIHGQGPLTAKIVFVDTFPRFDEVTQKQPLCGYAGKLFNSLMLKSGIKRQDVRFESLVERIPPNANLNYMDNAELAMWKLDLLDRLKGMNPNVIVPLGELPLQTLTDKKSIDKWHLSILKGVTGVKTIPLFNPRMVLRNYKDVVYLIHGLNRIKKHSTFAEVPVFSENGFLINPTYKETIEWLEEAKHAEYSSVDIETSKCQISCIGLGTSSTNVISIPAFPTSYEVDEFWAIYRAVAELLGNPKIKKIMQNGIYDTTYFSKYGITVRGFWHDTMLAQKFLYPELRMGLDNAARIFTERPYWKDEGSDWRVVNDWNKHYLYNCKDVAGTFDVAFGQRAELQSRNLIGLFDRYIMPLTDVGKEMCFRGLPVESEVIKELSNDVQERIDELQKHIDIRSRELTGETINPRSPKQVKELIQKMKVRIPVRKGRPTTDKKALKQLAIRYPDEKLFKDLLEFSKYNKQKSSYLSFKYDDDNRMRYSINVVGTETGRFSCNKDPFDQGVNAQTIPKPLRTMFRTCQDKVFIQIDLAQAEARFVAWDSPEPKLIEMYNNGDDIHRFVASRLFDITPENVSKKQRQLGKKIGHGSNYGMAPKTFAITCLDEMGLQISEAQAHNLLEGYHQLFPGIRRWHARIKEELFRNNKTLKTPIGRVRQFFDRMGDDLLREAYAYRPQSTIPDIINCMILNLVELRHRQNMHFSILLQVHDSVLIEADKWEVEAILDYVRSYEWHPEIILPGGKLTIPIDIETGHDWANLVGL